MRLLLDSRLLALWLGGIMAVLISALGFGTLYACVGAGVWCLTMMVALYKRSGDALDARAVLFFATFVFVIGPMIAIVLSGDIQTRGYYAPALRGVTIDQEKLEFAQIVVIFGLVALSVPMLFVRRVTEITAQRLRRDKLFDDVPGRSWVVYGGLLALTTSFVAYSFGGIAGAAAMAFDPIARDISTLQVSSGAYGLLFMSTIVATYYASQRLSNRAAKLSLFLPVIPLILPAANRGLFLIGMMVAAASVSRLVNRRVYIWILVFLGTLPLLSMVLLALRFIQSDIDAPTMTNVGPLQSFLTEATMAPTLAHVLDLLRTGQLNYVYGMDVILILFWFVPRALWPGKPLPLDYRLNDQLGLNWGKTFGTPLSLFGGVYINFTPYIYVVALALIGFAIFRLYESQRQDRLVSVFLVAFVLDLVRVGDIAREVWTLIISLVAVTIVRYLIRAPFVRSRSVRTVRPISIL